MLDLIGWKPLSDKVVKLFEQHDRVVLAYPHTSPIDYIFYILYLFSHDEFKNRARVLIHPRLMSKYGWLLEKFGALDIYKNNNYGGVTESVIDELNKIEKFVFLISPKGSCERDSWKTGYYHIAKKTNAVIIPGGFNYDRRMFMCKNPINPNNYSVTECREKCQYALRDIIPYYPEKCEYPLIPSSTSTSPKRRIGLCAMIVIIVTLILLLITVLVM